MNLYSVDEFYIELEYDSEQNKIVEVRSFTSVMHLDKYTNHVDLK